jgi:hypothetical protein
MFISSKWLPALMLALLWPQIPSADVPAIGADAGARQEFVAAIQRVRLNLPDTPDSPALEAYAIYDYLVAARFRRDLPKHPNDAEDAAIDAFLQAHAGQPVAHALRHDWLASLAERRRWDWYLPRTADVTDPLLVCDRLAARLATGDTEGLGAAALARWSLPQKQPAECNDVFAWLRQQNLLTPTLAETKARAALGADNPRLARDAALDVPVARAAALLQWSDLLEAPKSALTVLATHPGLAVEPDALAAGFDKLAHTDSAAASGLLPALLEREALTPALKAHLQRSATLRTREWPADRGRRRRRARPSAVDEP